MIDLTIPGWMSEKDLRWLEQVASASKDILEIGVYRGRATEALTAGGHVVAVDPWQPYKVNPVQVACAELEEMDGDALYKEVCERFLNRNVTIIRGTIDDIRWQRFDFIFLDGNHEYEAVYYDILAAL